MPKLYRIIEYDGPQEWIDQQVDGSIHGERRVSSGNTIRAATIDPEDKVSVASVRDKMRAVTAKIVPLRRETK